MSLFAFPTRAGIFAAAIGLAFPGFHTAFARDEVKLAQASPWNLDYAEDRCRLVRLFGEGDDRVVLVMEQFGLTSHVELFVAGKPLRNFRRSETVSLQMGPAFDAFERKFQAGNLGDIKPALIFGSIAPVHGELEGDDDPDTEDFRLLEDSYHPEGSTLEQNGAEIEWIALSDKQDAVRLITGNLAKPFKGLRDCTANLISSWGVDPEVAESVVTPPKLTNVMDVAPRIQRDYPSKALNRGQMANIQLRLIIDETGGIEDCIQLDLTAAENFQDVACDVFRAIANFEPARDAAGNPVRTYTMQRIRYIIG